MRCEAAVGRRVEAGGLKAQSANHVRYHADLSAGPGDEEQPHGAGPP